MCVPNLVPIGPQATTCIPSEGYTDTYSHTHTHAPIDTETVGRQSAPPKNDVLLIAEALAASVNANRLPVPEP